MPQLLHLRVGRFFDRTALGRAQGLAATLEMTARLDELAHRSCRAIEWFSATEAWCDLGSGRDGLSPWTIADRLHHEIKSELAVEVACGVASTRSASRAASAMARPSGLVVVLPGYEASILEIARANGDLQPVDMPPDTAPLKPAFVPRAIVRSAAVELANDVELSAAVRSLVDEARRGLDALGLLAETVRVQFATAAGTRELFATLADATSIGELIDDAADSLARRIVGPVAAPNGASVKAGRLTVSLSQLIQGPSQASLFGWRYDRHAHATRQPA